MATRRKRRRRRYHRLDAAWTAEMERTLRAFQPACVLCGAAERLTTDHVRPLRDGNGLRPGNAVRLCTGCNARKGSRRLHSLPPDDREKIVAAADAFYAHWFATGGEMT
jgi:5-methylcytosine-specific restriction endonuclease McrA